MPKKATDQIKLARILDPRFRNDCPNDDNILRRSVFLPVSELEVVEHRPGKRMRTALENLLDERSVKKPADNEVLGFLRATTNGDFSLEPLD